MQVLEIETMDDDVKNSPVDPFIMNKQQY